MHDAATESLLRKGVTDIHWFRDTLMAFRKGAAAGTGTAAAGAASTSAVEQK